MVIQCKHLISLYILPDQRRVNLLVFYNSTVEPIFSQPPKIEFRSPDLDCTSVHFYVAFLNCIPYL